MELTQTQIESIIENTIDFAILQLASQGIEVSISYSTKDIDDILSKVIG